MSAVIVVTGANEGIGFHMTRALLEAGNRVAALDVAEEALEALRGGYSERLLVCHCDVSDRTQVEETMARVMATWGRIDVLVNNACLAVFKRFEEKPLEETRREFEVNYFGCVNTIAAVLPHMRARGRGIIHNVGSGVGITGFPGIYGYASTKGAIESLTRTLALELEGSGVCVNLMHPPLTNTRSAAPLGVPAQAMDDPARVGRNLARRVFSTRPVVAADLRTAMYLQLAYRHPRLLGRLFARLTERARSRTA